MSMSIKIPIARPYLDEHEEGAVKEVIRSGWVSQGPVCAKFEHALARFVGVRHGRAVNSGTSAIHLALLACGVQPGDEVIIPAFTCVATLNPLEHIGARPVPVDIDLTTFGLDASRLSAALTPRTRAIIIVHLFGQAAHSNALLQYAQQHGLRVIEDAALGLGARVGVQPVGSSGDVACLSFHPRKMITTGEGGMLLTNSDEIAERVTALRNYGASVPAWKRHTGNLFMLPIYEHAGYNYKLTDLQAGIGLEQVRKLPTILQMRREIAQRYNESLADLEWLQLPIEPAGETHAYQSYVCLLQPPGTANDQESLETVTRLRERFWQHLFERGIASVQGAQAMPTIDYYQRTYGWNAADFPMALWADRASVALPIYPGLTEDEQMYVVESIRSFVPAAG